MREELYISQNFIQAMFDPRLAYESLSIQDDHQFAALKNLLVYLQQHSPYYKRLFHQHHINIDNVKTLQDISFIPTTSKTDMQEHNWDFLCVPDKAIKEYTAT